MKTDLIIHKIEPWKKDANIWWIRDESENSDWNITDLSFLTHYYNIPFPFLMKIFSSEKIFPHVMKKWNLPLINSNKGYE